MTVILALALGGCGGSSQGTLNGRDVSSAFQKEGVSLTEYGGIDGIREYVLAHDGVVNLDHINRLDVQVFPTVKEADRVQSIGGNIEASDGHLIAPLAVVRNVVVTIDQSAGRELRRRSKRAVATLRTSPGG